MIDHLSSYTVHYEAAKAFYEACLGALGFPCTTEMTTPWDAEFPERRICAFGPDAKACFWIVEVKAPYDPRHVAFAAGSREAVDAFHRAALAHGGTDHGAPGLRPVYHPDYYGAFALDPDGNNVEAVCHTPA